MNDLSRDYFPNLKRRMAEAGISGNRLAKALGHSGAGAVSRYLNGKQAARAGTIQKFEKAFQALIASGGTLDTTPEEIGPQRGAEEPTQASDPAPRVSEGPWGSVVVENPAVEGEITEAFVDWGALLERRLEEGVDYVTKVDSPALEGADVITPQRPNVWVCGVCGQENLGREARCPRCLTFR